MVKLREAVSADYHQVQALDARYHLGTLTELEWQHLYADSPFALRSGIEWPIGWVLETPENIIVGHIGNVLVEYSLNKESLVGASANRWVVNLDYRKHSTELAKSFFAQPQVDLFLNTTATWPSGRAFERLGALKPPIEAYDRATFWIVDHPAFAASLLAKKNIPLAQAMGYPVGALLSVASFVRSFGRCKPNRRALVSEISTFDEQFDRFWDGLRAQPNRLLCVRDRAALAWRFDKPLRAGNAWVLVENDDAGRLASYAVFLRQDSPDVNLRRMRLVDFQSLGDGASFLRRAIEYALARCYDESIHVLEVIGFGVLRKQQIEVLAPYQRQLPSWMFWYKAAERLPELAKSLQSPELWDPCTYDGDGCF